MDLFDSAFHWFFDNIPIIGPLLKRFYENDKVFNRFFKYGVSTSVMFWLVKGPLIYVFTEWMGIWYLISSFIVGLILAVVGFFLSEYWIWRKPVEKWGGENVTCKVHKGPKGGRYYVARKKGGGTRRVYLKKGEKPPK